VRLATRSLLLVPLFVASVGCQASVEGKVNVGDKSEVSDFDKPLDPTMSATSAKAAGEPATPIALLGARQDLALSGGHSTTCKCLAVALGQPGDAAFRWSGERPRTNSSSQLVIALSSAGQACPEAGDKATGASYWGYETVGNDVVVVVESAHEGRPLAAGGIIPRPQNGQVFVRPIDKKLPYGRPSSGAGARCQIGTLPPMAPAASNASAAGSLGTDVPVERSATSAP
jgi:hypothetical protein